VGTDDIDGKTSASVRLYESAVGAVSLIVTWVPPAGVGLFSICIQYVSPLGERYWCIRVCPDPTVLATPFV
jgi:hypothetical protein